MKNDIFSQVAMPAVPSNNFDLSHEVIQSFDIGELVPTCVIDCLPGDVHRIEPATFLRFAPLVSPVMARMDAYTHFFFVPYRLLWEQFPDWISGNLDIEAPYIAIDNDNYFSQGTIADYLGAPIGQPFPGVSHFITPYYLAAYRLIYDEYYRDQNLEPDLIFAPLVSGLNDTYYGPASTDNGAPFVRALAHDYFTSALPFAQKGDPVTLPLTFEQGIPVQFQPSTGYPVQPQWANPYNGLLVDPGDIQAYDIPGGYEAAVGVNGGTGATPAAYVPNGTLYVDVQSQAVTLETLRSAIVLQEFLERDARGGTRYTEKITAHFGVRSSDARLMRPEYIGGTKQVVSISEVLSTAQSDNDPGAATQFVGQMAGHGVSVGAGNSFYYKVEEHGCIIGITSVLPQMVYSSMLHRSWIKYNFYDDFAWPAFANLGEQVIKEYEVNHQSENALEDWGYQSRYAEYKSLPSRIAGEMRDSLSHWHLAVIYEDPTNNVPLNEGFIKAYPQKYWRIFAVPGTVLDPVDHIYGRFINNISSKRPLPRYGIPSFGSTTKG